MKNQFLIKLALTFFVGGIVVSFCGLGLNNIALLMTGGILVGYCTTGVLLVLHKKDPTILEGLLMCALSFMKLILGLLLAVFIEITRNSPEYTGFLDNAANAALIQLSIGCDLIFSFSLMRRGWSLAIFPGTKW